MLMLAADAAKRFGTDAKVGSNEAERDPFNDVRCLLQQVLVAFCSRFELRIDKALLQPDVIIFVRNSQQSFYFVVII